MPKVNCVVDSCAYWGNGNVCTATEITVAATSPRAGKGDQEVGQVGETKPVRNSAETQCVTFRPRENLDRRPRQD